MNALFEFSGQPDRTDPTRYRGQLHQAWVGLHLPYYQESSPRAAEMRKAYHGHVGPMLALSGVERARSLRDARDLFELERALAAVASTKDDGHTPSRFRVNAPSSNLPEFAAAFADRCFVW